MKDSGKSQIPFLCNFVDNSQARVLLEFQGNFEINNFDPQSARSGKEMTINEVSPGRFEIFLNKVYHMKGTKGTDSFRYFIVSIFCSQVFVKL